MNWKQKILSSNISVISFGKDVVLLLVVISIALGEFRSLFLIFLSSLTISFQNTAVIFFRRFYLCNSLRAHDPRLIMSSILFFLLLSHVRC
jgi:hypothetical protein